MDRLSKEQRHKNMAAIHSKNTKPEVLVRKFLFSRGFRYHKWLKDFNDLLFNELLAYSKFF